MSDLTALVNSGQFSLAWPIIREVVWEVNEHNFRLEVLALDRTLFPVRKPARARPEDPEPEDRDCAVSDLFPNGLFILHRLPRTDQGLGAVDWQDRMEYVEAFRRLLITWGGDEAEVLKTMTACQRVRGKSTFTSDEASVLAVERIAYPFYCQTFFNNFGRAASIPYPLPR